MHFYLFLLPFALQGIAMFVDEFYYHHKRGLPPWEVWGHPLDTFCFLACFLFLNRYAPNTEDLYIYIGLSLFSCLIVSKDEFVHSKLCSSGEMWLHSILFLLHPLVLGVAGMLWWFPHQFPEYVQTIEKFLSMQCYVISGFMVYQILYWSIPWKKILQSTTRSTIH